MTKHNVDPDKVGVKLDSFWDYAIFANGPLFQVWIIIQLVFNSPDAPLCGI